ncbi:anthranilate synthase component I family protein [Williamwhitmania taraxaci]|uniref:Anthranilate synthase component 1 n=1 Tax=Williamwhitmania taraxaci TaxID=1640674 RepID=A0A1G6LPR2_9BACT|nr:anthranilate synthase component I family protein [Williamwhitmania taraxaci]SDC45104.1 anthranilate synthase component 1 [Williamwhitmania taraxaci]
MTLHVIKETMLADLVTPVSIYLKLRDVYPGAFLLESNDYEQPETSRSFICVMPIASVKVLKGVATGRFRNQPPLVSNIQERGNLVSFLEKFLYSFKVEGERVDFNGFYGYTSYDAIKYFEKVNVRGDESLPEMDYRLFRIMISVNQLSNELIIAENLVDNEPSRIPEIVALLTNRRVPLFPFECCGEEVAASSDEHFKGMVTKAKQHCQRGDVFQLVTSRLFSQKFLGDEFNVYRSLRSINPSPYLFYFDLGSRRLFGSSPETQVKVYDNKVEVNPIAGTFRRTGNVDLDKILAERLLADPKENAEHVMLVDLARNDLSRNAQEVSVDVFRVVKQYSHVIHLVSTVSGKIKSGRTGIRVFADTFPAGTLSGAPKVKAMELIEQYEASPRGYYGGCVGFFGLDGSINQAITIRSFLSQDNTLFYRAGAGVVADSTEESELQEVDNKLMALRKAIENAHNL